MTAIPGDNPVCCTLPPIESNYEPKGTFKVIQDISTYIVGDKSSKKAIVVATDAFGVVPLTQQGCDLLGSQGFYVLMPDLLGDQAFTPEDIPFDTPEKLEKRNKFAASVGDPHKQLPKFLSLGEHLTSDGFKVGTVGFCWGGKLAFLAGASDVYTAVAGVHPSRLTPEEAANCRAIVALFPSKDEDPIMMEPFVGIAKEYKLYSEAFHGFAAARARLDDPTYKAAYADLYMRLSIFFRKYLS